MDCAGAAVAVAAVAEVETGMRAGFGRNDLWEAVAVAVAAASCLLKNCGEWPSAHYWRQCPHWPHRPRWLACSRHIGIQGTFHSVK